MQRGLQRVPTVLRKVLVYLDGGESAQSEVADCAKLMVVPDVEGIVEHVYVAQRVELGSIYLDTSEHCLSVRLPSAPRPHRHTHSEEIGCTASSTGGSKTQA